jgi:hypothetical protein
MLGEHAQLDFDLDPGRHQLEIRADGFTTQRVTLSVSPGEATRREITLHHLAPPSPLPSQLPLPPPTSPTPTPPDPDHMIYGPGSFTSGSGSGSK